MITYCWKLDVKFGVRFRWFLLYCLESGWKNYWKFQKSDWNLIKFQDHEKFPTAPKVVYFTTPLLIENTIQDTIHVVYLLFRITSIRSVRERKNASGKSCLPSSQLCLNVFHIYVDIPFDVFKYLKKWHQFYCENM